MSRIPSIESLVDNVVSKGADCNKKNRDNSLSLVVPAPDNEENIDVSVVTVCFNPLEGGRQELFQKNLDSVQAQEGVRIEHVIIDGASSDGTIQWLMDYKNTNHNICILSKEDTGIYDAMNRGIALAKGKYIIFLNSDDYFHDASGMAVSVSRLESLHCDFSFAPIRFSDPSVHHHPQQAPQKRLHRFLISWSFSHQSMLTTRAMLIKMDGFDTTYKSAADYDLLLRMIVAGAKGCYVPLTFSTFTLGGFSCSPENQELVENECVRILQRFYYVFYSVNMTYVDVKHILKHRIYPHKYLTIYKHSQKLIKERFIGIPQSPLNWISQSFNYIKYYNRCLRSKV